MDAQSWASIAFLGVTAALCLFMLFGPRLLGGTSKGRAKEDIYESGIVATGDARIRFSANFYLIAIFFVIFDLEALYLYVYAVSVKYAGWYGFWAAAIFAGILLIGLIYELSLGTLNWAPENRYKLATKTNAQNFDLASATKFTSFEDITLDKTGKIPAQSRNDEKVLK